MKKTLIALAALAAGSAFAQSSVSLYGSIDVGFGKNTGVPASMTSSWNNPTVFGLKGSEDLGGGLKANFQLESTNFTATDGGTGGPALSFERKAWVGVSGGFGEVRLGNDFSLATMSQGDFDLDGVSEASPMAMIGLSPVLWYINPSRTAQLAYFSPVVGGFKAAVSYVTAADNYALNSNPAYGGGLNVYTNNSYASISVNYANGPLAAGFVAEQAHAVGARTAMGLAGSYNFGVATVAFGLDRSEFAHAVFSNAYAPTSNNNGTYSFDGTFGQDGGQGYYLGVSAPFGATTVGAQFANNTADNAKAFELFANYSLSKRTYLYVDAGRATFDGAENDLNRYGVGIVHKF